MHLFVEVLWKLFHAIQLPLVCHPFAIRLPECWKSAAGCHFEGHLEWHSECHFKWHPAADFQHSGTRMAEEWHTDGRRMATKLHVSCRPTCPQRRPPRVASQRPPLKRVQSLRPSAIKKSSIASFQHSGNWMATKWHKITSKKLPQKCALLEVPFFSGTSTSREGVEKRPCVKTKQFTPHLFTVVGYNT